MCDKCDVLRELLKFSERNAHQNYTSTLACILEMIKQERVELFAGDCPIEEVEKNLADECHDTIRHYFRCRNCNQLYYVGVYIRGTPVYKKLDNPDTVRLHDLWGRYGAAFQQDEP